MTSRRSPPKKGVEGCHNCCSIVAPPSKLLLDGCSAGGSSTVNVNVVRPSGSVRSDRPDRAGANVVTVLSAGTFFYNTQKYVFMKKDKKRKTKSLTKKTNQQQFEVAKKT